MLCVLAQQLYPNAPSKECYSQSSYVSLTLQTNSLYIVLDRLEGVKCDFPRGVLVSLSFVNTALNTYQIFDDFGYETTYYLIIDLPCANCIDYDDIRNMQITISSPRIQTTFMAGALQNVREYADRCDMSGYLEVVEDISTGLPPSVYYVLQDPCAELASLSTITAASLTVQTRTGDTLHFNNGAVVSAGKFAFSDQFEVQKFYKGIKQVQFDLKFKLNDILRTFQSTSATLKLGAGEPLQNIELTVLLNSIYFSATRDSDFTALNTFLDANGAKTAIISIYFKYGSQEYIIQNPFEPVIFEENGQFQCEAALDPASCSQILAAFTSIDNSQLSVQFIFEFYDQSDASLYAFTGAAREVKTVCFEDAAMNVTRAGVKFELFRMKGSTCIIQEKMRTNFALGYYKDYMDRVKSNPQNIISVAQFVVDEFNQDVQYLQTSLTGEQFEQFYQRRDENQVFSYQLLVYLDGALIQNIDIIEYSLIDSRSFTRYCFIFVAICEAVAIAVIAISVALRTVLKDRFTRKSKTLHIIDDI